MPTAKKNICSIEEAFLCLKNKQEVQNYLCDLLTQEEIKEIRNRWKSAQMLWNKVPYSTIKKETGLSSTTIARVSKWLQGKKGGYKLVIKRMEEK